MLASLLGEEASRQFDTFKGDLIACKGIVEIEEVASAG